MTLPRILEGRLTLPAIAAPMFIVSVPDLVIAECRAGIVGAFPALNARPKEQLDEWLAKITEALAADPHAAPFAVNQIVHKSNDRLEHDVRLCVKYKVPIVITSLGLREDLIAEIHAYGGIILHDIISLVHAHKAVDRGADGLIAVAAGAGGHAGALSPFALIQEIRAWFDGPLALSGAIATGSAILAAQAMGADLAYIGSALIATAEARAAADYKQMIVDSAAADIVYSDSFTGVKGNYLKPSVRRAGLDPDNLPPGTGMSFASTSGDGNEAKAWRDIWSAGQGIGVVDAVVPVGERIAQMKREYDAARARLSLVAEAAE